MKMKEAAVWWFPGGQAGAVWWDDVSKHKDVIPTHAHWMPVCFGDFGKKEPKLSMFVLFNSLVVRDRVDPQVAHGAFLAIDEYR